MSVMLCYVVVPVVPYVWLSKHSGANLYTIFKRTVKMHFVRAVRRGLLLLMALVDVSLGRASVQTPDPLDVAFIIY